MTTDVGCEGPVVVIGAEVVGGAEVDDSPEDEVTTLVSAEEVVVTTLVG